MNIQAAVPADFESLGDNCEFGFVQRMNGIEPGGLLRWAISFPDILTANIANGFDCLYQFDNLTPHTPAMVSDAGTGLKFHSKLKSQNGVFIEDEAPRRVVHAEEAAKIGYLRDKLLQLLASGRKHFIYKHNHGVSAGQAAQMANAIAAHGPAQLLIVHQDSDPLKASVVERAWDNLFFGYLPAFAPYAAATDFDLVAWMKLLENAAQVMPKPQA